ncbi:hypothetical protein Tco_1264351 [Tanacetum coccineum]
MTTLKFADTHNLVAFLSKPAESEGFEQIVDFLNANPIRYALTVNPTIYTLCIEQFWATVKVKTVNGEVQLQALVDGKKIIITESTVRRDLQLEDAEGVDCLPNATIFEQLTLMGSKTAAWNKFSSAKASAIICLATNQKFNFSEYNFESMVKNLDNVGKFLMYLRFVQVFLDRGNINKTRSKATLNEPSSPGTSSGSGPTCQETMGDTIAQTRFENVSKHSNDPLLARGNTLQSGENRLKLKELMELCTNLQTRVLDLETIKTTQANEIASLKGEVGSSRRVESSEDEGLGKEDAFKQGRIADIDANEDIYLVNVQTGEDMFGVNDLDGDEVIVESVDVVNTVEETRSMVEEVTTVTILEQAPTPTVSSQQPSQVKVQDKCKGKMVEPEPMKKMSKKDLLMLDEELAFKLQAKEE